MRVLFFKDFGAFSKITHITPLLRQFYLLGDSRSSRNVPSTIHLKTQVQFFLLYTLSLERPDQTLL